MVRGSSQSQSQSASSSMSRPGLVAPPRGTAAAAAGLRRRRVTAGGGASGGGFSGSGGGASNMLRFYTDDVPGLKITPTVVLVMSLCFIAFVTVLHVVGKFYRYKSAGSP